MNDAIRNILQEKHPAAEEARDNVLDNSGVLRVKDVIFERLNRVWYSNLHRTPQDQEDQLR